MKAVIEFYLPEEQSEFESAVNGWKWQGVVWDFLEVYLRSKWKHEGLEWAIGVRDEVWRLINDKGLQFE